MKRSEKKFISILIILSIIIIVILLIVKNNSNVSQEKGQETNNEKEFTEKLSDGTELNISEEIQKGKKMDGLEINNIQIRKKGNVTLILGNITNTSNETKGGYKIKVKVIDKEGNEIISLPGHIRNLEPNETEQLNVSATFDYVNAYDIEIIKD